MKEKPKILNDENESSDDAMDNVSGANLFSDKEERERIREHAKNRLESFLNQSSVPGQNLATVREDRF
jgi:hypothetical protein